ncbi:MAG: hypothetical protein KA341_15780 [Saprospiraceae bacterium]|nr:hypothetical protein [Saprospiraceae bacterium]
MKSNLFTAIFLIFGFLSLYSQDDMLSLLGDDKTTDYANASFKTNRVINLHSLENTAAGVLDFKISHRFGTLNGGFYELFGLDNSSIRLGFEYGLSDLITVGVGRSSFEKAYDGFIKYKFLRQSTGERNMPITAALLLTSSVQTLKWDNPDRDNYFSSRLYYTTQLILGRKFSESFTFQLSPTMVHRNLVKTNTEKNDVYALGAGGRIKLSKRVALNAEYIYLLPNQVAGDIKNSLSVGFDIETGGHVFQLHCSNSTSMIEKGFIAETANSWTDGGIHFGFNISRVFTVKRKKTE